MEKLQSSSLTVSDNFCASICTLFSFLTPQQRTFVNNYQDVAKFCSIVSAGRLIESLVHQSIGFSKSPQSIDNYDDLKDIAYNAISIDEIDQWKYVVDGPAHSGKSTILSLVAKEAIQNLAQNAMLSRVFIFSINWESATQRLTDIFSLYDYIAAQTIFQLIWQYPKIFPIAQSLLNWILSIPTAPVLPVLSLTVQNMPLFPTTAIEVFGKRIFASLKNTKDPVNLVREIVSLPSSLASCFGFEKFLFIYDHLDLCNMDVRISSDDDDEATNDLDDTPVCILDAIISQLANNLFFFSSKAPQGCVEALKNIEYDFIHVENSVPASSTNDAEPITVYKPNLKLNIDMCQGCPQFIHKYLSIIRLNQELDEVFDESQKKRGFKSVAAATKQKLAKAQLIELCSDLFENGLESIDSNIINQIKNSNQLSICIGKPKIQ